MGDFHIVIVADDGETGPIVDEPVAVQLVPEFRIEVTQ